VGELSDRVDEVAMAFPAAQRRDVPTIGTSSGSPSERRDSSCVSVPYAEASIPVGIDSTRAGSRPLSRTSCARSASPVVTTRAVALR